MATVTKTKEVCDVCGNTRRRTRPYRVGEDGVLVRVVLCREHGEPLDSLIKIGSIVQTTAPTARVWTMEEIEARKKKTPPNP